MKNQILSKRGFLGKLLLIATLSSLAWYSHAASGRAVRIMALGDSLTSSIEGQASYRYWLYQKLVSSGFNVDFVGTMWGVGGAGASGIYANFDQNHEGHVGASTQDILDNIDYYMSQNVPDIVLLLIGSNDFGEGVSVYQALYNTKRIIGRLRAANPNVSIVWAMVPPEAGQVSQDRSYNSGVLKYARMWSNSRSPIRIADLFTNFHPSSDTVDGEHPNATGEKKFASRFYNAMYPFLGRY